MAVFSKNPLKNPRLWMTLLLLLGGLYALASLPWCPLGAHTPPTLLASQVAASPLLVGAAKAEIVVPHWPATSAGYGPFRPRATGQALPLYARAVALKATGFSLTLLSLDALLVPEALVGALRAQLGEVLVVATHSHSALGGFDRRWQAQVSAMGRFHEAPYEALFQACLAAAREAQQTLRPAYMASEETTLPGWTRARSGSKVDERLLRLRWTAVEAEGSAGGSAGGVEGSAGEVEGSAGGAEGSAGGVEGPTGGTPSPTEAEEGVVADPTPIAQILLLSAHPTLVGPRAAQLHPDYPGELALLEEGAGRGLTLVWPAAVANARVSLPEATAHSFAQLLHQHLEALPASPAAPAHIGHARVGFALPAVDASRLAPQPLRGPANNLLCYGMPPEASLSLLRLGTLQLVAVPFEASAEAAEVLESAGLGRTLSVAGDYLGYVETPAHVEARLGESALQYFDKTLLERLVEAAQVGR